MILDTISGIDSIVEGEGRQQDLMHGGSGSAPDMPSPSPSASLPRCGSCGKDASVRRWYATADPLMSPEFLCGACAFASMRDTCGSIAAVLFDLGAAD